MDLYKKRFYNCESCGRVNTDIDLLLNDVKNGKPLSFDAMYHLYTPLLDSLTRLYSKRFSLAASEIDDIKQEAAIALYKAAIAYKPTENTTFGAYAKVCLKNRILSYIRYFYGNKTPELSGERDSETEEIDTETPEQLMIDKESLLDLNRKIEGMLTHFEQSVFALYVSSMSYEDMAKTLSKPKKSIDNAIHRIKAKLKRLL